MSPNRNFQRRSAAERVAAWLVTGPVGHLFSFVAEAVRLWTRAGIRAARRRLAEGAVGYSSKR
ncbi:MAG: hypothetical protein M3088_03255 [Actinomycetota bacterium]|nr:hypothetical protein [Actinomycetota bacterium]